MTKDTKHSPLHLGVGWDDKNLFDEDEHLIATFSRVRYAQKYTPMINAHADLVEALKLAEKALHNAFIYGEHADATMIDDALDKVQTTLRKAGAHD